MDTNDLTAHGAPATELVAAIDEFLASQGEDVMSANRVINPLLHLWQLANDHSREAAIPLEQLLTALNSRKLVTAEELRQVLEQVLAEVSQEASAL
jgi:methylthioribose-1-phosphate isomerase